MQIPKLAVLLRIFIGEDDINRFLPMLDGMMSSGLITMEKVQVLQYGEKTSG